MATTGSGALRVAVLADCDAGDTFTEIRARGVPGAVLEPLGSDPADVAGHDLIHVDGAGPAAEAAARAAQAAAVPLVGSIHAGLSDAALLRDCAVVLSPSRYADAALSALGVPRGRLVRWERGLDLSPFGPERAVPGSLPGTLTVLYAGALTRETGVDLMADAFLRAHEHDARLHLVIAGSDPEHDGLRERLGVAATFLARPRGEARARLYASADLFLFPGRTDVYGEAVLEAQASGLPVLVVRGGGAAELVEHGATGWLADPEPEPLGRALVHLARRADLRLLLGAAAHEAVIGRGWDRSLRQLARGYELALRRAVTGVARAA